MKIFPYSYTPISKMRLSLRDVPTRGNEKCGMVKTHKVGWEFYKILGFLWVFFALEAQ